MSSVRSYLPESVNENVMYGVGIIRCYAQPYLSTEFNANALATEPRILVGDLASASNREAMKEQGITHVLCALNGGMEQFPGEFEYLIVHANDDPWVEIDTHFEDAVEFIDSALRSASDSKILVHCQRGASRSVTLVSAYLLYNMNRANPIAEENVAMMVNGVIDEIHEVRDIACPNNGFVEALKRYVCHLNSYEYVAPVVPAEETETTAQTAETAQTDETDETAQTDETDETDETAETAETDQIDDEPEADNTEGGESEEDEEDEVVDNVDPDVDSDLNSDSDDERDN